MRIILYFVCYIIFLQSAYYWPWQNRPPDNVEYAIYLAKRTLRNKQRHGLEEYEIEALGNLRKNLANKWDFITMQAEEQVIFHFYFYFFLSYLLICFWFKGYLFFIILVTITDISTQYIRYKYVNIVKLYDTLSSSYRQVC